MAYTAGIFCIDYINGSDTARTALTSCTASNPSGTITRITKTAHGLTTGAVVDLTLFSSWLNSEWKITRVDADNFDLDTAVWQTTADTSGTVTPRGGSSWTDAWKTVTSGATAARHQAGDEIRFAKSPDPISIGNATWTNLSKTITLATAQTATVNNCEALWTSANSATASLQSTSTDSKEGNYCTQVTAPASPATSTKYAYFTITLTDFSAYQKLSFWFKNEVATSTGHWKLCLCSDTTGDVIVDTFSIIANPSTLRWIPLTIARTGNGNLGNAIQSVALYSDTVAPTASKYVRLDNIIACTTNGLNLQSLISKEGNAANVGTEGWWLIQSIVGVTVMLDGRPNSRLQNEPSSYYGTTETVNTYIRETIKIPITSTYQASEHTIQRSGSYGSPISYKGGYNISSNNLDGQTFFDGLNCYGAGMLASAKTYINVQNFSAARFGSAISFVTVCENINITNCYGAHAIFEANIAVSVSIENLIIVSTGFSIGTVANLIVKNLKVFNNNGIGIDFSVITDGFISDIAAYKCTTYGVYFRGCDAKTIVRNVITDRNTIAGVLTGASTTYVNNLTINETTEVAFNSKADDILRVSSLDGVQHNDVIFNYRGIITKLVNNREGGSGFMYKVQANQFGVVDKPIDFKFTAIAVTANSLVTVKAFVKKTTASAVQAQIVCKGYQISGVNNDVVVSKANDTNWEELTLTFTPTASGAVYILFRVWDQNSGNSAYIADLTITQA
jgi:hypothetical protein